MSIRRMCDFFTTILIAGVLYTGCLTQADAQNVTCATRPSGDSSNACASTAFVQTAIPLAAITGLTGDVTATGPGNVAATLATVNSNVGSWGSATQCPSFTVNAKGLITAASQVACTPSLTVGTTAIASGTTMGVLYNNAGVLGNTAAGTADYALMGNGASAPSFKGFVPSITGAITRTWNAKVKEVVSITDFAVCDGSTDNTAAIQAFIDAAPTAGIAVYIPPSAVNCVIAGTITDGGKNNIVWYGGSPQSTSTPASVFVYTGSGTRVWDLRDSTGWVFQNLGMVATNNAFAGTIIDFGSSNVGVTVSKYGTLDRVSLIGNGTNTPTCVNVSEAVEFVIHQTSFTSCNIGVRGQQTLGQSTVGKIWNSQFFSTITMPISDCGESWSIIGTTFEQLKTSNNAGAISINSARPCKNIVIEGNWFGDANTTGTWITLSANGASIVGNRIANGAVGIALDGGTGYSISNNNMENTTAFSCANSPTGGVIGPNTYSSVTTYVSGTCVNFNIDGLSGTAMVTQKVWLNATSGSITQRPATGALGTVTQTLPAVTGTYTVGSTGAIDNAALRADGTGGSTIQASPLIIADTTGSLSRNGNGGIPIQGTNTNDDAAAGYVGEEIKCSGSTNSSTGALLTATVTISNASPAVVSWTGHGLSIGAAVYFTTTGTLPTGLSPSTNYYVSSAGFGANSFQVSTTVDNALAGTSINTSSAGSGTHTGHGGATFAVGSGTINLCGMSLTAGDWDISVSTGVLPGSGMTTSFVSTSHSLTSATLDASAGHFGLTSYPSGSAVPTLMAVGVFPHRHSLSATTTMYATFAASIAVAPAEVFTFIRARRVR